MNNGRVKVPFNINKCEEEKLDSDLKRFVELIIKHQYDLDDFFEFAELCKRLHIDYKNKYKYY